MLEVQLNHYCICFDWIFVEIPYISLHDFAAINDSMCTRVRHFDPNFWQCGDKVENRQPQRQTVSVLASE